MWRTRRANKYGNKSIVYNGIQYASKIEAGYAAELDLRKKAGDIKGWDRQVKVSLDVNGFHIANYYCDFVVYHNDETKEYVEIKSNFTYNMDVWRLKRKLMEATFLHDNKEIKYTVVIM